MFNFKLLKLSLTLLSNTLNETMSLYKILFFDKNLNKL